MGFLRGGTSPNSDLLPLNAESVFWGRAGGMTRILLTPLPTRSLRFCLGMERGAEGKAGQVFGFEKPKA